MSILLLNGRLNIHELLGSIAEQFRVCLSVAEPAIADPALFFIINRGTTGAFVVDAKHIAAVFVDLIQRRLKIQSYIGIGRNERDAELRKPVA